ncbi:hypothetical protein ABH935_006200 [Catenulispora sp. GAS73]
MTGKDEIHRAFRAKYAEAQKNPASIQTQDWDGLRAILQAVLSAFM